MLNERAPRGRNLYDSLVLFILVELKSLGSHSSVSVPIIETLNSQAALSFKDFRVCVANMKQFFFLSSFHPKGEP